MRNPGRGRDWMHVRLTGRAGPEDHSQDARALGRRGADTVHWNHAIGSILFAEGTVVALGLVVGEERRVQNVHALVRVDE